MAPPVLKLAVCLFEGVASTDFQGPVELFGFISPEQYPLQNFPTEPAYLIDASYFSTSMDAVRTASGPKLVPTRTYDSLKSGEQFDIVLVPGGPGSRPGVTPSTVLDFIKAQAPGATYILGVCTGAEILARAGILAKGNKATTNKKAFNRIKGDHPDVEWVAVARWVIDGKIWTSSGVIAGTDMAYEFLERLVGSGISTPIRCTVELPIRGDEAEEEFARYYGLI